MENYKFLSFIENLLISIGYDNLSVPDKNTLIADIADQHDLQYNEIDETTILIHHKKIKTEVLSQLCDETIESGFDSNGHHYRATDKDQSNFIGKATELTLDPSVDSIYWRTEDAGYILHTREEFIQVFKDGIRHKETHLFRFNSLKQEIEEATTDVEVKNINW